MALLEADKVDIATDLEPNLSIYEDKGYRPVLDQLHGRFHKLLRAS